MGQEKLQLEEKRNHEEEKPQQSSELISSSLKQSSSPSSNGSEAQKNRAEYAVKDITLASAGKKLVDEAAEEMQGFKTLLEQTDFIAKEKLKGAKILFGLSVNACNGYLAIKCVEMGARLRWAATRHNEINDSVAAYIAECGIPIYAWSGTSEEEMIWCVQQCIDPPHSSWKPNILVDFGGFILQQMRQSKFNFLANAFRGVVENSLWGIEAIHNMREEKDGMLPFKAFDLYHNPLTNLMTKRLFPQEALGGALLRTLPCGSVLCAKLVLVIGFGSLGASVARQLRSARMIVYVAERSSIEALKAAVEGFKVTPINTVIDRADIVVCCSNEEGTLSKNKLLKIKSGSVLINMGKHNSSIDTDWLMNNVNVLYQCTEYQKVELKTDSLTESERKDLERSHPNGLVDNDGKIWFYLMTNGIDAARILIPLPNVCASVDCVLRLLSLLEISYSKGTKYSNDIFKLPKKLNETTAKLHLQAFNCCI